MKMKANKEKVKEFVKEHKKELIIAGATMVAGGVMFAITKQKPVAPQIIEEATKTWKKDIPIPHTDVGIITDLWNEGYGYTELIVNNITVKDLGDFGKELLKVEGVTAETCVSALIGMTDDTIQAVKEF